MVKSVYEFKEGNIYTLKSMSKNGMELNLSQNFKISFDNLIDVISMNLSYTSNVSSVETMSVVAREVGNEVHIYSDDGTEFEVKVHNFIKCANMPIGEKEVLVIKGVNVNGSIKELPHPHYINVRGEGRNMTIDINIEELNTSCMFTLKTDEDNDTLTIDSSNKDIELFAELR